jgi:serine phosphatase RsbU (regulator of sigma subunit)/pSer/pThr/pTyr-binding forkhead associated (FHA) protein
VKPAWLIPISGPPLSPIELSCDAGGHTLGRHEACAVTLPPDAEQVSRQHARIDFADDTWQVTDLASRWGTTVNGVRLTPRSAMPVNEGDLIGIAPWTFLFSHDTSRRGVRPSDDAQQTMVRSVGEHNAQPLAEDLLKLLLESASKVHSATNEAQLAEILLRLAKRGTGLSNAVMLRPTDGLNVFDVIASDGPPGGTDAPATFSRSLVNAAASGNVAEIAAGSGGAFSQSLVQMSVSAAICAPLMLGGTAAAFLYVDSRGTLPQPLRPNASAFCVGLSRIASLAFANLKRIEIEKRQSRIDAELHAAAAAQKWILPKRELTIGRVRTVGESRPGAYVGGDFFDVLPLSGGRVAVALGDVSGKGVSAGVLMTLAQGFLHAALLESGEPGVAVTRLNAFIAPRRPANKFVTLWAAVIDPAAGTLRYVDAAHSYALLKRADGTIEELNAGGGLPIGVMDDGVYEAFDVPLAAGDTIVVVSDGIVEQPAPGSGDQRVQFDVEGLRATLASPCADIVAAVFDAVVSHAQGDDLADDATALYVELLASGSSPSGGG